MTRGRCAIRAMPSGRSRVAALAVALAAMTSISHDAAADEGGISRWLPGLFGSLAAAPQVPSLGPDVDPFILHLFAALAEQERAMLGARTKAALAAAKARGVALGGPKLAEARERAVASNKALADAYAANVLPVIREIRRAGATSLHQIANVLNARGITTPRGGRWYAKSVSNVLARA
jgi:hypothetical protein